MKAKRKSPALKCTGITASLRMVLRHDKWQTAPMIAPQIVMPPDAIARHFKKSTGGLTLVGAKSHIVARALSCMVRVGEAEKQKVNGCKNEYRLAAKPKDQTTTNRDQTNDNSNRPKANQPISRHRTNPVGLECITDHRRYRTASNQG